MARSYQRAAEAAEKRAITEDGKVSKHSKKLGQLATDLANAEASLDREIRATARRNESAQKAAALRAVQDDARRRQAEKRHAQEIARISQPVVRYVHEVRTIPAPMPEVLHVLYLTANPELDLRTEVRSETFGRPFEPPRIATSSKSPPACGHARGPPGRPQRRPPPRRPSFQPRR